MCMNDLQYGLSMFSSNMYCNIVYSLQPYQKEFMFVVNKGVFFFLLHNAVNKFELQRAYAVKMLKHTYLVSCTQLPH